MCHKGRPGAFENTEVRRSMCSRSVKLGQLPQVSAPKNIKVSGKNKLRDENSLGENEGSGQPSHEPVHRVVAGDIALRRFSRCRPLPNF